MIKLSVLFILFSSAEIFAASSNEMANETVKLNVATQTYQCQIANQNLNCNPINQVQSKVIDMPKNNGKISISDAPKALSLDLDTSLNNGNVTYSLTLCSAKTCTINDNYSNATGVINQVMLGQYNITESSFYVLGVSITSTNNLVDFNSAIIKLEKSFHKN